jgi:hypothetical protein
MPKRKQAADEAASSTSRRAVVAARVVVNPGGPGASPQQVTSPNGPEQRQGGGFGWSSLLSGLPGEPDEEDHEGWVERLFGNERSGCTSPPNAGLLGEAPSPSKNKRVRGAGARRGGAPSVPGMMPASGAAQMRNANMPPGLAPMPTNQQTMVRLCRLHATFTPAAPQPQPKASRGAGVEHGSPLPAPPSPRFTPAPRSNSLLLRCPRTTSHSQSCRTNVRRVCLTVPMSGAVCVADGGTAAGGGTTADGGTAAYGSD